MFLGGEEREFLTLGEEQLVPHTVALLKKISHNNVTSVYKLGETERRLGGDERRAAFSLRAECCFIVGLTVWLTSRSTR